MGRHGHFIFLLIYTRISKMTVFWTEGVVLFGMEGVVQIFILKKTNKDVYW